MSETFKKIDCLGDWVAVVNVPLTSGALELPDAAQHEFNCEGVVVGIGPDAEDRGLNVGDRAITTRKNHMKITPQSGGYEGKVVNIMRYVDVLVRKNGDDYKVVE